MHTKARTLMAAVAAFFIGVSLPFSAHAQPNEANVLTFLNLPKHLQASLKIKKVQPLDTLQGIPQPDGSVRIDAVLTLSPKEDLFGDNYQRTPELVEALTTIMVFKADSSVAKYIEGIVVPDFMEKTGSPADKAELILLMAAVPQGNKSWEFRLIKGMESNALPIWGRSKPRSAYPPHFVIWGSPEAVAKISLMQREAVAFKAIKDLVRRRYDFEMEAGDRVAKEVPELAPANPPDSIDEIMRKAGIRDAEINRRKMEAAEKIISDGVAQILAKLGPTN